MSYDPRVIAQKRIQELGWLIKAADAMIQEEQRLIASDVPYADHQYDRVRCALLNAAFDCFQCDELYEQAREIDPDWIEEVAMHPVNAGLGRRAA